MGYYENPPIINMNKGSESIAAGAASAANSIAEALIRRGDRKRAEEKEQKLTNQKLQEEKNRIDLYYNDYMSDFSKNQPKGNPIADQSRAMLQKKIERAADARLALTMETDPEKRKIALKLISDAESFMDVASKFGKQAAGEVFRYKETPGIAMNTPGGVAINASGDKVLQVTDTLNILSGMTQDYEGANVELEDLGDTFAVKISGKNKNGRDASNVINASDYLNSDGSGTGGFLQNVENIDDFKKQSLKSIIDPETKDLYPGLLVDKMETVKLPSGGGDAYEIVGAQRLNLEEIKKRIKTEADVKASGYLRGGDAASMRALVNSTLGMGPNYYDDNFKGVTDTATKVSMLSGLLEKSALNSFLMKFKSTKEGGTDVYWSGNGKPRMVEKPENTNKGNKTININGTPAFDKERKQELSKEFEDLIAGKTNIKVLVDVPEINNSFNLMKTGNAKRPFKILDKNGKEYSKEQLRKLLNKRSYTPTQKLAQETGNILPEYTND